MLLLRTALLAVLLLPACTSKQAQPVASGSSTASAPASATTNVPKIEPARHTKMTAAPIQEGSEVAGLALTFQVTPGVAPCTLRLLGNSDGTGSVTSITAISADAGPACVAHALYKGNPDGDPDEPGSQSLEGGLIPQEDPDLPVMIHLADYNFDGHPDLSVVALSGMRDSTSHVWLYDPPSKRFIRNKQLEDIGPPSPDYDHRRFEVQTRTGDLYSNHVYGWEDGKLELLSSRDEWLGSAPAGKTLPPGFQKYLLLKERKGGKLIVLKDGPAKETE